MYANIDKDRLSWIIGGEPPNKDRITTTVTDNYHALYIRQVNVGDIRNYTCTATDESGLPFRATGELQVITREILFS